MTKKIVFITVVLALVALPLLAACETTPDVIELTFNDHNPPTSTVATAWLDWAEWVETESGGRLDINIAQGGALFTGDEVYRAVQVGSCDGGHYVVDREDGFLLNLIMALPFLGWTDQHVEDQYMTLLDEFDEMQDEWEGVKIVGMMMMPPTHIHTTDKSVVTPADLKGLKIMGAEAMTVEAVGAAGGTAVEIGIMDMTPSLQTGLIDGVINHFPVCGIFGALELLEYHTVFGGGGINMTPMFIIMNPDTFDDLPSSMQDLIMESGVEWQRIQTEWDNQSMAEAMALTEGHNFNNLTAAQIKVWYDLVKSPIHDEWIAECEAAGLPGQALYERALELVAAQ